MKTLRTASQVREGLNNKFFSISDRTPVIVTIPVSKRKQDLGVQFWTNEAIATGESINSDGTVSKFIELY